MHNLEEIEEAILTFAVSDEALERAAGAYSSLGNCTDARICQAPNSPAHCA
jgi:hypothetical protein